MVNLSTISNDLFIDGDWRPGRGASFTVINPTTGEDVGELSSADESDVDIAVAAATRALHGEWAAVPPSAKGALLLRLADLVERDSETLTALEAADMGIPVMFANMMFIPNLVASLRYYAGWADKLNGENIVTDGYMGRPVHAYTRREPIGVIAQIIPWNAPLMILGWKLAPALAAGNAVIVKPAENASLSILHLARLVEEAGFPSGTVQVLTGPGAVVGEALARHHGINKISFTGSTEVGRRVVRNSAENFKRVTVELGGKSPQIIFGDADLNAAINGAAVGLFANQGEICAAGTRILAHRSVYEAVLGGLAGAAQGQVVGDPFTPGTTVGPLISAAHRDRVMDYVRSGQDEGATLVAGGTAVDGPGFFVNPTVFAGTNDMKIAREEIFGPVGTVIPFDTDEEAVAMANDNKYGLAATVWTKDVSRAHSVSAHLQAGAISVNGWSISGPSLPWGGVKASGEGRELGQEGILANTELKTVAIAL